MTHTESTLMALVILAAGAFCLAILWAVERRDLADKLGQDVARLKHANEVLEAELDQAADCEGRLRDHRDRMLVVAQDVGRDVAGLRETVKRHEQGIAEQERCLNELQEKYNDALDLIDNLRRELSDERDRRAAANSLAARLEGDRVAFEKLAEYWRSRFDRLVSGLSGVVQASRIEGDDSDE